MASAIALDHEKRVFTLRQSDSTDERSQDKRQPHELAGKPRKLFLKRRDLWLGPFNEP